MYTLIAFATEWGSKHGGINSFNGDFLKQFGAAYHHSVEIVCVVTQHTPEALDEAAKSHVRLIALPYVPASRSFDASIGSLSVELLGKAGVTFEPEHTVWLGHDLITGEAAIAAAKVGGGRSAVIHHMSYSDYESYAEDSQSALRKTGQQTEILKQADLVLAIGPLLRDAASDRVDASKQIHMLVPGLAEIDPREAPKTFVAFLSGRLTPDAARIKQGHLGIAAFAAAESKAHAEGGPESLKRQPKLLLRGVDFENRISDASLNAVQNPETDLKDFTEEIAKGIINLHALPYTESREQLYSELSGASVALMPSWHEGFGLVAWEAIAAGVPLILSENSGVYRLLEEEYFGAQKGFISPVDVRGKSSFPYYREEDRDATAAALKLVAMNPGNARNRASMLRNMLLEKYRWTNCCENAAVVFGWDLQRGSVSDRTQEIVQEVTEHPTSTASSPSVDVGPLKIPRGQWRPGAGMADSQLLRAEEELLPFDTRREPDVEKLKEWIADTNLPLTVRLVTGDGGQGKTRLAIHVCRQLRDDGWHSGFLDSSLEVSRMPLLWRDLNKLNQPVFIVVDYAETRQEAFLTLLKAALENPIDKPVRMLLLARNGGEWWDNLPSANSSCEGLLNGPATTGPFPLPPLYEEQQDRQQAFSNALRTFAQILQVESPQIVPELVGDQFERPLFVQMAALLALYGERPTTIQGLTKALLNHERRYWLGLLAPLNLHESGKRAEQLLALATLAGGFPTAKLAENFWNAAKRNVLRTSEFNSLFRNLAALYPGTEGLQALRPDLLGEALVAQALLRPEGDVLLDAVLSSTAAQSVRRNALTVLARLCNERDDVQEIIVTVLSRRLENCAAELVAVSMETVSRLPELAELAFGRLTSGMKNQVAGSLKQELPRRSVQLGGFSCVVFAHAADRARQKHEDKPNNLERVSDYVWTLDRYADALSDVGRYEEACEISHSALVSTVKLRSRKEYESFYAGCLYSYAFHLTLAERDEEALTYSREALAIRARLRQKDPEEFEPAYARSLDLYAINLANGRRTGEALTEIEESIKIYQKLITAHPGGFDDSYAFALANYSVHLAEAGKYDEALTQARKALDIRERLKRKNPDRFEPNYLMALSNYAASLTNTGRLTEALNYMADACAVSRRLAQKKPQRFTIELLDNTFALNFLEWLCNRAISPPHHSFENLLSSIPHQSQLRMRIQAAFMTACITTHPDTRLHSLSVVLSNWDLLSQKQKSYSEMARFCAAAWCEKFASLVDPRWRTDWQNYLKNHNGNMPFWMSEVARRLDFEFPSFDTSHSVVPEGADGVDAGGARGGIEGGGDGDKEGEEDCAD